MTRDLRTLCLPRQSLSSRQQKNNLTFLYFSPRDDGSQATELYAHCLKHIFKIPSSTDIRKEILGWGGNIANYFVLSEQNLSPF
jgi:Flp pilus assembly CpaE family ATPase